MTLPSVAVDRVLDELIERGHVRRPFVGVAAQPVALAVLSVKQHELSTTQRFSSCRSPMDHPPRAREYSWAMSCSKQTGNR